MRKCIFFAAIFFFYSTILFADNSYKTTVVISKLIKEDMGDGYSFRFDLPFQVYAYTAWSYGRDITYVINGQQSNTLQDNQEFMAWVFYIHEHPTLPDDTPLVMAYPGNLGDNWEILKVNPYYRKHYPYVYESGGAVPFGPQGGGDTQPHDPILWTDEIFPTITVYPNIPPTTTTPEPASMLLFGIGSLAMVAMKRRKRGVK